MTSDFKNYTSVVMLEKALGVRMRDPITKEASFYTVAFTPRTFTETDKDDPTTEGWTSLDGTPLRPTVHPDVMAYHAYIDGASKKGKELYGVISPMYQFLAQSVGNDCGIPFESLRTVVIDIEVASDGGFAPPDNPTQPIIAITAEVWGEYFVWGCGDYTKTRSDITYIQCADEAQLLKSFMSWWTHDYPDIVTGWNISGYDIPYIVNRINMLKSHKKSTLNSKMLSPWKKLSYRIASFMGRDQKLMDIGGVAILDYLELYRKFSLTQRESYRLDAIAEAELGKKKVAYDEYGSLQRLADGEVEIQDGVTYEKGSVQQAAQLRKIIADRLGYAQ